MSTWPSTLSVAEIANVGVSVSELDGTAIGGIALDWQTTDSTVLGLTRIGLDPAAGPDASTAVSLVGRSPGTSEVVVSFEHPGFDPGELRASVTVDRGDWPSTLAVRGSDTVEVRLAGVDSSTAREMTVQWTTTDPSVLKVEGAVPGLTPLQAVVTAFARGSASVTATVGRVGLEQPFSVPVVVDPLVLQAPTGRPWVDSLTTAAGAVVTVEAPNAPVSLQALDVRWETGNVATLRVTKLDSATALITPLAPGSTELIAIVDQVGFERVELRRQLFVSQGWSEVFAGGNHSCGLTTEGDTYCWGAGFQGQLGYGGDKSRSRPTPLATFLRFYRMSLSYTHTCGILETGRQLYCWGGNQSGQLGSGSAGDDVLAPQSPVQGISVKSVATGLGFTMVVDSGFSAAGFGDNFSQLLAPDTVGSSFADPTDLPRWPSLGVEYAYPDGDPYRWIAAGAEHACALMVSQNVYCWGRYERGVLGSETLCPDPQFKLSCAEPVQVDGGLRFTSVTAGFFHTCGRTDTGEVYCWGDDSWGQLGAPAQSSTCMGGGGSTPCSPAPTLVAGRYDHVDAGGTFTCALDAGEVFCWGSLTEDGSSYFPEPSTASLWNSAAPTPVGGALRFTSIAVGDQHFCGVVTDPAGALFCWGREYAGQLGHGLPLSDSTFVRIEDRPVRVVEPGS